PLRSRGRLRPDPRRERPAERRLRAARVGRACVRRRRHALRDERARLRVPRRPRRRHDRHAGRQLRRPRRAAGALRPRRGQPEPHPGHLGPQGADAALVQPEAAHRRKRPLHGLGRPEPARRHRDEPQPVGRPRRDRLRLRRRQRADRDDRAAGDGDRWHRQLLGREPRARARDPDRRARRVPDRRPRVLLPQAHRRVGSRGRPAAHPDRAAAAAAAAGAARPGRVRAVVGADDDRLRGPLLGAMRSRTAGSLVALLAAAALLLPAARAEAPRPVPEPLPPPAGKDAPGLPPLPEASPRNASYAIEARLDPDAHRITGVLVLDWRNTSDQPLSSFPFHLYWNAFRNNLSTTARGEGRRAPDAAKRDDRSFGWTEVKSIRLLGEPDEDLLPTLRYLNEDGNADDRTVMEVRSARTIAPGASGRFRIEWQSLVPHGTVGRA